MRPDRLGTVTTGEDHVRTPPGRHTLKLLIAPVIVLMLCTQVANAMWATLYEDQPLLLISLSSINRYLILVSDQLDAWSYYLVGTARLLISDPLFFLLGYWYGDKAMDWMAAKSPSLGPMIKTAQRVFGKAAWPLVVLAPNNWVCLLAGAAGMRITTFFALNLAGTVGRLYAIRVLGTRFSGPIDDVREFIGEYQMWFLGASILIVMISLRGEFRRGGDIEELVHLDETLLDDSDESTVPDPVERPRESGHSE